MAYATEYPDRLLKVRGVSAQDVKRIMRWARENARSARRDASAAGVERAADLTAVERVLRDELLLAND